MGICLQLKIVLQKTIDSRAYTNILNNIFHTENPEVLKSGDMSPLLRKES